MHKAIADKGDQHYIETIFPFYFTNKSDIRIM
jgi:hypothetical protein